ncbi:MAG: GNAT family N-acetyltransferase [bacterium]|nr:GNAT family N-acetyltransferase [bacterium]
MFVKLNAEKYDNLKSLFTTPEFVRASAVLHLNRDGEVYADNPEKPNIVFINTSNFSYMSGDGDFIKNSGDFKTFFAEVFGTDKKRSKRVMKLVSQNGEWNENLLNALTSYAPYKVGYRQYEMRSVGYDTKNPIPDGYAVKIIDGELLKCADGEFLGEVNGLIERTLWGKNEKFFESYGGACILHDNKIVSYSFMFYNGGDDSYELSIKTDPNHRLKGLGAAATAACAEEALKKASTVRWTCKAQNEGSVKTALKVGFELVKEHEIVFVELK